MCLPRLWSSTINQAMDYTLALIKPDVVAAGKAAEMQQLIELAHFTIIAQRQMQLTRDMAEAFYMEHQDKPFYAGLVEFITSGPLVALVLAKQDAVQAWQELAGPTDVFLARMSAPRCLRALYGTSATRNAVHGSDSETSAAREVGLLFPSLRLRSSGPAQPQRAAHEEYIKTKLQPTLLRALTALAREKPTSRPDEAVTWLARYLLDHNPHKPAVQEPPELARQAAAAVQAAEAAAAAATAAAVAAARARNTSAAQGAGLLVVQAGTGAVCDDEAEQNAAATKVQAAFRGHQARKLLAGTTTV